MPWRPGAVAGITSALRRTMRQRGISVAALAQQIGVSEPTAWRWLGNKGLTLDGLDAMCAALDLDMADLLEAAEEPQARFTLRQERLLAADRKLSLLYFSILHGATRHDLERDLAICAAEVDHKIALLVRVGLVRVTASGRLRPLASRTVEWRRDGPLAIAFEQSVKQGLLAFEGDPSARYVSHMLKLSAAGRSRAYSRMEALYREILEIADEDAASGHDEREWSALFMLVRPLPLRLLRGWVHAAEEQANSAGQNPREP